VDYEEYTDYAGLDSVKACLVTIIQPGQVRHSPMHTVVKRYTTKEAEGRDKKSRKESMLKQLVDIDEEILAILIPPPSTPAS
jgi:hypothetical protein